MKIFCTDVLKWNLCWRLWFKNTTHNPKLDLKIFLVQSRHLTCGGITPVQRSQYMQWLLMAWLLVSPKHQHPWYWLCSIGKFLSYARKDFRSPCHVNVEKWHKMKTHVYVSSRVKDSPFKHLPSIYKRLERGPHSVLTVSADVLAHGDVGSSADSVIL